MSLTTSLSGLFSRHAGPSTPQETSRAVRRLMRTTNGEDCSQSALPCSFVANPSSGKP